ncbi:helix-turn-helix domain-containing protein [Mycolicibacterium goodii]|uniref:helix-turn-helix domain-containing protein n=1 Tax=Mycolicibacterium goodii TaxID=134601 RepID=UPI001BDD9B76|nr:helix-turn-helix transcriptional regulator [Mycolicibacterium goodii]MBU8816392.1 helix-turn-helix domain-containing protein [Mycolicibacterium goodii]MBU8833644.1 helix-turn-helix domain-containing protein [Mycolicibacterium goodii]
MTVQTERGYVYPSWSFGDRIRKARDVAGLTQHEFAVAIGVPDGSLANWETDRAKPRDIVAVAKRVEMLTRIPAGWMLGIEHTPDDGGPTGAGPTADKSS